MPRGLNYPAYALDRGGSRAAGADLGSRGAVLVVI